MKKINRKAQGSGAISVLATVAGMLVIGAVILVFVVAFGRGATGAISAGQCKSTIELVQGWNDKVDEEAAGAKSSTNCDGANVVLCIRNPLYALVGVVGSYQNAKVDQFANMAKPNVDLCIQNLEVSCPNVIGKNPNAADAAECVYKHAVTTYYTLQGGRSKPKLDFDLFKMNIEFYEPGTVTVAGRCEDYLASTAPIIPLNSEDECFPKLKGDIYICGKNGGAVEEWLGIGQTCQITFSRLNEATMTLAMVSRCQNETPGSSACKLFADPDKGYSTVNGLPNMETPLSRYIKTGVVFSENGADYYPPTEYGKYRGAGYNSDFTKRKGFVQIGKDEDKSKAQILVDSIHATKLDIDLNEQKTCKFRLRDALKKIGKGDDPAPEQPTNPRVAVYIEGEEALSACDDVQEEEPNEP